ncbi:FKBP-type peptidyl-prolyl cis-trans isomerase [Limibacter armeniacum]|uniref:FKBP-type peptidyl-prolyl cis-trans isomerase n=1 Tax=Limibacter armeniacum TaxID=466084 RepID=UPI002FE61617
MKADNNKVVSVLYTLYENNVDGRFLEKTPEEDPFSFIFGTGGVLQEFENNLKGKKAGDKFEFVIQSEDAYGPVDPNMSKVEIEKSIFGLSDEEEMEAMFQVGHVLPMLDQDGFQWDGKIIKVKKNTLIMDLNHEYAGMNLYFKGEVIGVREATREELDYGEDGEDNIEIVSK